ncbi:hypothetical protein N7526_000983 [Penicillium atrosanguineum]|nr:hypothetical protein N7526_000983 [Penicillium atrosanguineum]
MRSISCTYAGAASPDSPATEISETIPGDVIQLDHPAEEIMRLQQQQQQQQQQQHEPQATFDANLFDCLFSTPDTPEFIQALSYPFADPEPYGDKVSLALATHSMELLFRNQSKQLDDAELVAVLQAVVIYAIILITPSTNSDSPRADHNKIFRKMEQLVWHVVRTGLFLQEEREQTRPTWEAWVHVTSKRRAVLALYLLHWAYSVLHRVPCFDCRDLGFMPAPAAKKLWQMQTEQEWNKSYIQWLARWDCQGYLQGELGSIRPGVVMNTRAERWFEETDEFGFLMISIGITSLFP